MEQQLELGLKLVRNGIRIRYISEDNSELLMQDDEICIDKSKIDLCPDEHCFISSVQKKINRSDLFKSQKHTLGLCVLILLSKGYSVTSSSLIDIPDLFVERCWACIEAVSHNVPENIFLWIRSCMETRSPSSYAIIYCQYKIHNTDIKYLGKKIQGSGTPVCVNGDDFNIPESVWHRDDAIYRTMISHMLLRNRELSGDRQGS